MKPKPNTMRSIQRGNRRSIQLLRPGRQAVAQVADRPEPDTPQAAPVTAAKARIKRAKKRHYARGRKEPYKLTLALIRRFCEVLRSCPGLPVEAVCDSVGITRTTYYAWLEVGRKEPGGLHGEFSRETTKALGDSWLSLHELAARARPEQVLFRRYASFYPLAKVEADLTSGGLPLLPSENSFSVLLELHPSTEDGEPEFRITTDEVGRPENDSAANTPQPPRVR